MCDKHASRTCQLRFFGHWPEQHRRCCYCGHRVVGPAGKAPAQTRYRWPWWWALEPLLRYQARHYL